MGPENTNVTALKYPKLRIGLVYTLCAALSTTGLLVLSILLCKIIIGQFFEKRQIFIHFPHWV
jgi:hypothetical protein